MREFSFIIDGRPMSKKRNWTIGRNRNGIIPKIVLTKKYKEWHKSVIDQLWVQRMTYQASMIGPWEPITGPVEVTFIFYIKRKGKYDLSNLYQGIEDALVDAQILEDDSLIESHDGSRKHVGDEADMILIKIRPFKDSG
jgi:Holliday junction resolvase RusA-like endonuclease